MSPGRPAVFLDRDGVLNHVVERDGRPSSPRALDELRLVDDLDAVNALVDAGHLVFITTNQPDIARGHTSTELMERILDRIRSRVHIDDIRICAHEDADACACRKPEPGMLLDLARHWHVDLARSWMIGDMWRDVEAARAAGCRSVLIRRNYNRRTAADVEAASLTEAIARVLENGGGEVMGGQGSEPVRTLVLPEATGRSGHAGTYLDEVIAIAGQLDPIQLETMAQALADLRAAGGRLFFLGVGGSAASASHATNDFRKLAGIESYCATDNVSELTARTNDDGWHSTFVEFLRGSRLTRRDGVFVFSVGGGHEERNVSPNLVHALQHAVTAGARIFGVVGRDGGFTARVAHHCVLIPTVNEMAVTPHTESFHAVVWHLLVSHPLLQRTAMKWESITP